MKTWISAAGFLILAGLTFSIFQITKCNIESNKHFEEYRSKDSIFVVSDIDPYEDSIHHVYYIKSLHGYTVNGTFNSTSSKTRSKSDGTIKYIDKPGRFKIGEEIVFKSRK